MERTERIDELTPAQREQLAMRLEAEYRALTPPGEPSTNIAPTVTRVDDDQ